jgi:hypothetical protein
VIPGGSQLVIEPGGTLNVDPGTLITIEPGGSLINKSATTLNIEGAVYNSGDINNTGTGNIIINAGGVLENTAGTINNNGNITVDSNGRFVNYGTIINERTVTINNRGMLRNGGISGDFYIYNKSTGIINNHGAFSNGEYASSGFAGSESNIINEGIINSTNGFRLYSMSGTLNNSGEMHISNVIFDVEGTLINNGTINLTNLIVSKSPAPVLILQSDSVLNGDFGDFYDGTNYYEYIDDEYAPSQPPPGLYHWNSTLSVWELQQ